MMPPAYRPLLILVALTKSALQSPGIKAGMKLKMLEHLNGLICATFPEPLHQSIAPANDTEWKILMEASKLDAPKDKMRTASFQLLAGDVTFGHFMKLNASIAAAAAVMRRGHQAPAAGAVGT
jgi:hypothetical protein